MEIIAGMSHRGSAKYYMKCAGIVRLGGFSVIHNSKYRSANFRCYLNRPEGLRIYVIPDTARRFDMGPEAGDVAIYDNVLKRDRNDEDIYTDEVPAQKPKV